MNRHFQRYCKVSVILCGCVLLGLLAWLNFTKGDPDLVPGDAYDGRLLLGLAEHWHQVFQGKVSWHTLPMFYPAEGSLGYSDGLFLFGCLHSFFRLLGFDLWTSWQLVFPVLAVIGFLGMYLLLHKAIKIPFELAIWGAFYFVFSNQASTASHNSHLQLLSIWFCPLLFYIFYHTYRNRVYALLEWLPWGIAASIGLGSLALTGFYMLWFLILFSLLVVLVYLILENFRINGSVQPNHLQFTIYHNFCNLGDRLIDFYNKYKIYLWVLIVLCGLAMLPFFLIYLPQIAKSGGHSWENIREHLPRMIDFINSGNTNLWWGNWIRNLKINEVAFAPPEHMYGWPIFTALVVLLVVVLAWRQQQSLWMRAMAIVFFLLTVLMLRWGNFSLWQIIYESVPGASAVRAVFRYQLFLTLPFGVLLLCLLVNWYNLSKARRIITWLGLSLLLVEQINYPYSWTRMSKSHDRALLSKIPSPPPGIRTFYVSSGMSGVYEMENTMIAWWVAQKVSIPTLNGYSGLRPKTYFSQFPGQPGYDRGIFNWMYDQHIFKDIGRLDLLNFQWSGPLQLHQCLPPVPQGENLLTLRNYEHIWGPGWSDQENWGRWSDGNEALLRIPQHPASPVLSVEFQALAFLAAHRSRQRTDILLNDRQFLLLDFTSEQPKHAVHVPLTARDFPNGFAEIRFLNHDACSPASLGVSGDQRVLGIGLTSLILRKPE